MAAQQTEAVTNLIQQQVLKAAEIIEERLDQEIKSLDELKSDDIEKLRERRLLQLKKEAKIRQEYLARVKITFYSVRFIASTFPYNFVLFYRDTEITMN